MRRERLGLRDGLGGGRRRGDRDPRIREEGAEKREGVRVVLDDQEAARRLRRWGIRLARVGHGAHSAGGLSHSRKKSNSCTGIGGAGGSASRGGEGRGPRAAL